MAKLITYPRFKAYNSDGTALANGTVNTYIAGTTTNKATYTDSTEGTANANPVVLDAYGEADIWLLTDQAYKFVIKDSSGTTVHTIDNIVPISDLSTLDNDLDVNGQSIVSSSNGDIAITPNGTGDVILDGLKWPQADGTNGQVIVTDGAGQLSFSSAASVNVVSDTTPQLGGDLDGNGYDILFDTTTGIRDENDNEQVLFTTTTSAVNYLNMTNAATGSGPALAAAGSDVNIDFNINAKGSGNVTISGLAYPNADGTANQVLQTDGSGTISFADAGGLIQYEYATDAVYQSATTAVPLDDTIPQNTEGDEIVTVSITPTSSTNILIITASIPLVTADAARTVTAALFQDSTADALSSGAVYVSGANVYETLFVQHTMAAGTTSSTTFKLRVGPEAGTAYLNGSTTTRILGGAAKIVLEVTEVPP